MWWLGRTLWSETGVGGVLAAAVAWVGNVLAPLECKLAPFF
jgi:hypothetical protein